MSNPNEQNPFKGLFPYEEKDNNIFKGRDRETSELFKLVKLNILTVIFGQSGTGKTSLIHAGLFPRLRESNLLPVLIRLDYSSPSESFLKQVIQRIQNELSDYKIREMEKDKDVLTGSFQKGETLWEYFHRVRHVEDPRKKWTLVLVFDQFEEFFTIGKNHPNRDKLMDELYYLVEDQIPDALQKRFVKDGQIYPYIHTQTSVRVVLGLREDYLPRLNTLKQRIPSIDRVLFRVIHLNGRQAREVMNLHGEFTDKGIQDEILQQFYPPPGEKVHDEKLEVEPSMLSFLCYQMFETGATSLSGPGKDAILSKFYDETLGKLPHSKELAEFIETRLLTESGFRTPLYMDPNFKLRKAVEEAVNQRILRKVFYGQKEFVEITHDVLVPVIKERRKRGEARKRQKKIVTRIIVAAGIVGLFLAIMLLFQVMRATRQYKEAMSNRLAVESTFTLPLDNIKALRIAEAAYRIQMPHPSSSAQQALSASAYSTFERPFYTENIPHKNKVMTAVFSPDGTKILTTSMDDTAKIWDLKGNLLVDLKYMGNVSSAVFSPDGTRIITTSYGKTAKIWDLNGRFSVDLNHTDKVWYAGFSPDGRKIITCSGNTVKLWDLRGNRLADLKHTAYVSNAVFSPDGTRLATASWDNTAKLWDLSGKLLKEFKHTDYVWSAYFSPDGKKIITASNDKTAKVWDLKGIILKELRHNDRVLSASFSPDGNKILTRSGNDVKLWSVNGDLLADLNQHADDGKGPIFSPDGKYMLTRWEDTAKLWDVNGKFLFGLKHTDYVSGAVFSNDGQNILTCSGNTVKRWDNSRDQFVIDLYKYPESLNTAVFSPDGSRGLTWSDKTAKLLDLNGNFLADLKYAYNVRNAIFSPDGSKILTVSLDKTVKLWDLQGNFLADLNRHTDTIICASFSPDGSKVLTASWDQTMKLWDLNGKLLADLNKNMNDVEGAVLSPDASKILTWWQNSAKLWDWKGKHLADFKGHTDRIWNATFSPDGIKILTVSNDNKAKLWDLKGNLLADLNKHTDFVTGAVFSPDGTKILTVSNDNTAKLWDLEGNLLADLDKHTDAVLSATFSSDGTRIITVSSDGTVKRWNTPEAIIQWLKTAPIPKLTEEDKKELGIADF